MRSGDRWRKRLERSTPSPITTGKKPHMTNLRKVWADTLRKAGVSYFAPYELRHTFATRLSAGGVADHMVTQMLRQSDSEVFKLYSHAKLGMMREALAKLDRQANERFSSTQNVN
jgi:integrase